MNSYPTFFFYSYPTNSYFRIMCCVICSLHKNTLLEKIKIRLKKESCFRDKANLGFKKNYNLKVDYVDFEGNKFIAAMDQND